MKRSEYIFTLALIPLDIFAVAAAFILAYYTRSRGDVVYIWNFVDYFRFALTLICFWIVIFAMEGLYKIESLKRSMLDEVRSIFLAVSSGIMLVVVYIFLSRTEFFSRLIIIYAWIFAIIIVSIVRIAIKQIRRSLMRHGIGVYRTIVVGDNQTAKNLINAMNSDLRLGFKIIKIIDRFGIEYISSIIDKIRTDEIILADPNISDKDVARLIIETHGKPVNIKLIPNLFRLSEANLRVETIADIPLIVFKKTPLEGWGAIWKRLFDLVCSAVAIVVLSPVIFLIALIIKITSKGPVIYKNIRVGQKGNFVAYKFRTMYTEYCTGPMYGGGKADIVEKKLIAEKNIKKGSAVYKIADDPRITSIGKFLRKVSLDELPQFYNVLIGSMSLVGPRPHQPREVDNYKPQQKKLLNVKPGITGMAQISGRSDLTFDEEAKLDIYYIENWSFWHDIKIIVRTFKTIFASRGAY